MNVQNLDPFNSNPHDRDSGYSGVARNMTCLGELMKGAGFSTHIFGKLPVAKRDAMRPPF